MTFKKVSIAIIASTLISACGGDGASPADVIEEESGIIIDGEEVFSSMDEIQSVLQKTDEITAGQDITFVLPEAQSTLALTRDLKITGNLTIK